MLIPLYAMFSRPFTVTDTFASVQRLVITNDGPPEPPTTVTAVESPGITVSDASYGPEYDSSILLIPATDSS